jgi:hypothetical protein
LKPVEVTIRREVGRRENNGEDEQIQGVNTVIYENVTTKSPV